MENIKISFEGIPGEPKNAEAAFKTLTEKSGAGAEFTGWIDLPENYDKEEFARIKKAAEKIRSDSSALVVCGIGGSYLGAAAALDFLKGAASNARISAARLEYIRRKAANVSPSEDVTKEASDIQIYFAGNNMAPAYIKEIYDAVKDQDFSINVISKSGTTMETSISFRIFRKLLEDKYGKKEAARRIYATTDKAKGALKSLSDKEGYEEFTVPDDIGGRYSVLTAVGLLPIAAAGCDINALMAGAFKAREEILSAPVSENEAAKYAAVRQSLYESGKAIEIFANYDPDLRNTGEWLKQLFGESEGKDGKGIFPASVNLTSDLHSMGQMIQEGARNIFETVIRTEKPASDITIPAFDDDFDGYKYLEGKPLSMLNDTAIEGTYKAHLTGGVPQIRITVPDRSESSLGALFYFFEFSCGVSAYISGVNPFNQPGVEEYKKNIRELLSSGSQK